MSISTESNIENETVISYKEIRRPQGVSTKDVFSFNDIVNSTRNIMKKREGN